MALLNKSQFLTYDDRSYKTIDLNPYIDGEIKIKSLSGEDTVKFEKVKQEEESSEWVFWLVMKSCINEDGTQMFSEETYAEDLKALKQKSASTVKKLFQECIELNSVTQEKVDKEAKNS